MHLDALRPFVSSIDGFEFVEEGFNKKKGFVGLQPGVNGMNMGINTSTLMKYSSTFRQQYILQDQHGQGCHADPRAAGLGQGRACFGPARSFEVIRAYGSGHCQVSGSKDFFQICSTSDTSCLVLIGLTAAPLAASVTIKQ